MPWCDTKIHENYLRIKQLLLLHIHKAVFFGHLFLALHLVALQSNILCSNFQIFPINPKAKRNFGWFCFHSIWNGRKTRAMTSSLRYFPFVCVCAVCCGGKASQWLTEKVRSQTQMSQNCSRTQAAHIENEPVETSQEMKCEICVVLLVIPFNWRCYRHRISVFFSKCFHFNVFDYRSVQYFWQTTHITDHLCAYCVYLISRCSIII